MNNLKFRAWYKGDLNQSLYMPFYKVESPGVIRFECNNDPKKHPFTYDVGVVFADDDWIVEQYTGLKDINGKEIYVGDVVRYDRNIGRTVDGYRFVVTYDEGQVFLDHNFNECYDVDWDYVVVVGNIHENKEFLE